MEYPINKLKKKLSFFSIRRNGPFTEPMNAATRNEAIERLTAIAIIVAVVCAPFFHMLIDYIHIYC